MVTPGTGSSETADRRLRAIVRASWMVLGLLLVQDLLGMGLNLYVDLSAFPTVDAAFRSAPLLDVHVLTGFALIAACTYVLARAFRTGDRGMELSALAGFGFVLLAFLSGVEFTFFGQADAFSFLMEVGFVGIVGCVAVVLVRARDRRSENLRRSRAVPAGEGD